MRGMKLVAVVSVLAVALVATSAAAGAERGKAFRGLKALGLEVYWSLLTEGQKEQAKEIATGYLADTAPDRLAALARLLRYKADVAGVLTREQRIEAGRIRLAWKRLTKEGRRAYLERLLGETDRAALAERVERAAGAGPEARVEIALEILDQLYEALGPRLAGRLGLTGEQVAEIRVLYGELKTDLRPLAVRIETARQAAVRKGIAILDESQREKLGEVREAVLAKVLEFIRGG